MFLTIIVFIIILSALVLVHELGHFTTARLFGVRVQEFGLGLPPRAWGLTKDKLRGWQIVGRSKSSNQTNDGETTDTVYSLNWLPLGGFVKIKGEQGEAETDEDSFSHKPLWQRGVILAAGVTMNVVLTIILLSVGFYFGLPQIIDQKISGGQIRQNEIQITEVLPQSPAKLAKLEPGDVLVSLGDITPQRVEEVQSFLADRSGQEINISLKRQDQIITGKITPIYLEDLQRVGLGISLIRTGVVSYGPILALWHGLQMTVNLIWQIISGLITVLQNLLTWQKISVDVVGPVGIAVLTGTMVKLGWIYVLQFTALLSITLAIINFLPLPALDGGRFLFIIIAKIRGQAINQKIENLVHNIGFLLLLSLILIVTFRDIYRWQDKFVILWHRLLNIF